MLKETDLVKDKFFSLKGKTKPKGFKEEKKEEEKEEEKEEKEEKEDNEEGENSEVKE
jgi:hypothetical protein